jgi:polyadenylate-binding protein
MNGFALPSGEVLSVSEYRASEKKASSSGPQFTNLYVKNFPRAEFDDNDLQEIFSKYGEISSAVVMRDENQQSKGFGFVCFKDPADARRALQDFEEAKQANPVGCLYVKEALSKEQRQTELSKKTLSFKKSMQYLSLHVRGFPQGITPDEVRGFFYNLTGYEPRGIKVCPTSVLVSFNDRETAKSVKDRTNGALFNNLSELEAFYFEPKELREINRLQEHDKRAQEEKKSRSLLSSPLNSIDPSVVTLLTCLMGLSFQ